jgi:hypothetical protein
MTPAARVGIGLAFLLAAACAPAAAQDTVTTVTRLVKIFSELEARLDDRLAAGDTGGARAMLAEDFELRDARSPGTPVPLAAWLERSTQPGAARHDRSAMAVHDYGGVAVVSFAQGSSDRRPRTMIVDVWKGADLEWKLSVRYTSEAGSNAPSGASAPKIEKRY